MENKNIPHDDKELDLGDRFDEISEDLLKKAMKKARNKQILRTILICTCVIILLFVGVISLVKIGLAKSQARILAEHERNMQVFGPNQYMGTVNWEESLTEGKLTYTKFKMIEEKVVYTGEESILYGPFKYIARAGVGSSTPIGGYSVQDGKIKTSYNELGQRQLFFYYPFLKNELYKNDLPLLDEIDKNEIMEIALSFDKEYTMDEVKKMVPQGVTLTWYWINNLNEKEKKELGLSGVCFEKEAIGIKAISGSGAPLEDPLKEFSKTILEGVQYNQFIGLYQNLTGINVSSYLKEGKKLEEIKPENIHVMGIVVTGDTEKLKSLRDLPVIKAATIGVITDKY